MPAFYSCDKQAATACLQWLEPACLCCLAVTCLPGPAANRGDVLNRQALLQADIGTRVASLQQEFKSITARAGLSIREQTQVMRER